MTADGSEAVTAASSRSGQKFVVAFNRDRDFYQLPLALHEAGLLSSLVTDLYYPFDRAVLRHIPGLAKLRHRCAAGLPSAKVHWTLPALLPQVMDRIRPRDNIGLFERVDAALSEAALDHAEKEHAQLFLYSNYAFRAFTSERARALLKGLFVFHPHADLIRNILDRDFAQFPECRHSYEAEYETSGRAAHAEEARNEWRYADFIVCASGFTARSLKYAGCRDELLSVVPYGVDVAAFPFRPRERNERVEFLFVGQGVQRKGLHHLLHAWNRLRLPQARLTIVATNLDPGIAGIAGNNVRVLPRQGRAELVQLLNASDVFAMPSLIEGFGLIYLEALAAGCHCIGTLNTGLPDLMSLVPDGVEALSIVEAGSVEQLCATLETAYGKSRSPGFDRQAIRGIAERASWPVFRSGIAAVARRQLTR